jgi:hypothetical protein
MLRKIHTGRHGESGQALVTFALMITVMMAMLALVLDLGLLFGQRRFDQNGADAAALKVGHMLAGSVSPRENPDSLDDVVPVYFGWSESDVYTEARRYAGLRPSAAHRPEPEHGPDQPEPAGHDPGVLEHRGPPRRMVLLPLRTRAHPLPERAGLYQVPDRPRARPG